MLDNSERRAWIADHHQICSFRNYRECRSARLAQWRSPRILGRNTICILRGALYINETKGRGQEVSAVAVMIVESADCDKMLGLGFQAFDVVGRRLDALLGHVSHDFLR